jgi:hypothetical protein
MQLVAGSRFIRTGRFVGYAEVLHRVKCLSYNSPRPLLLMADNLGTVAPNLRTVAPNLRTARPDVAIGSRGRDGLQRELNACG